MLYSTMYTYNLYIIPVFILYLCHTIISRRQFRSFNRFFPKLSSHRPRHILLWSKFMVKRFFVHILLSLSNDARQQRTHYSFFYSFYNCIRRISLHNSIIIEEIMYYANHENDIQNERTNIGRCAICNAEQKSACLTQMYI